MACRFNLQSSILMGCFEPRMTTPTPSLALSLRSGGNVDDNSTQPCGCDKGSNYRAARCQKHCLINGWLHEVDPPHVLPETSEFLIKDSGVRAAYDSGMVRDVDTDKVEFHRVTFGPMFERYARHITVAAKTKYLDDPDGTPNWMKANSLIEWARFRASAFRHFIQWFCGATDEDHASAVYFNINGAEYVKERLK